MKTKHKTLKMDPNLTAKIDAWCVKEDRSFNWFMSKAAEEKISREVASGTPTSSAPAGAPAAVNGEKRCPEHKRCRKASNN